MTQPTGPIIGTSVTPSRLAIVSWSSRRVGGTESYLGALIPALRSAGREVSLWCETDAPGDRDAILPGETPRRLIPSALRSWKPDLLFCHGVDSPELEAELLDIAPAVFFAHGYYGTCISGAKTWKAPAVRPCSKPFSATCLLHFYPHRCGGLNPATMLRDYARQRSRRELLRRYRAIVTHSAHMKDEYVRNGFVPERVHSVTFPVSGTATPARAADSSPSVRVLFAGRMDRLKGGDFLVDAIPSVRAALNRRVEVTFAGDGPERESWMERAGAMAAADGSVSVRFPGWVSREVLDQLLDHTDVLGFPSVWPEPFGLAGLEAGLRGVPVAAFATGGVTSWLADGVNGFTAPGDRPLASELAAAIVRCVEDPAVHTRLRQGARETAQRFTMTAHLADLEPILQRALA